MLERVRRAVARDLENEYGFEYEDALLWMQEVGVFGNWTEDELLHRPIDLAELADCIDWAGRSRPSLNNQVSGYRA